MSAVWQCHLVAKMLMTGEKEGVQGCSMHVHTVFKAQTLNPRRLKLALSVYKCAQVC